MSTKQTEQYTFINSVEEEEPFDLYQTLGRYIYHWPYFLVGLLATLSAALLYLQSATPEYEIKATLLVHDEKKTNDEKSTLQELDLARSPKLVESEIEVLKSRKLIIQVVNDLRLWSSYQKIDGFKKQELYLTSPILVTFFKANGDFKKQVIEIIIKDEKTFYLKGGNDDLKEYSFNNSFGYWKLEPSSSINQFAGATILVTLTDPEIIADALQNNIEVLQLNKLAPAISLSYTDVVKQRGIDILNRLIFNYNQATISEKNRLTRITLSFIDQRLDSLSGDLNTVENKVEEYRSSQGLTDISSQSQVYLQNVQVNDNKLNEVNVQLNVIKGIETYINSPQNSNNLPSVLGISDPALSSQIETLSLLQLQKNKLLATAREGNPAIDPINRQISTTRSAIRENIQNIKSALLSTKNKLQSFNARFESSIRDIPGQERRLIGIKRQQAIKENLYTYLLQKREELSLSYAATQSDARVVDNAYAGPVKEKKAPLILGIAFLLGLAFPSGFIYAKQSINNRITTRKEIEDKVDIQILTELNFIKTQDPLVVLSKNNFEISEQFRSIRANLHFLHGSKKKGRVTLLTSSIADEGKSFVSSNLALALAISGRKTVILELDLRKPKISDIFNLPAKHSGISNYLSGQASIENMIQNSDANPNLDIISSGTIPSNPSELLEQPEIETLIIWLRENYDDIIMDTPPVRLVSDGLVLSKFSDVTLYLIRQGHTFKSLLPSIKSLATDQHFPNMNIVFNGIQKRRYGYGNDYGNGYYQQKQLNKSTISKSIV